MDLNSIIVIIAGINVINQNIGVKAVCSLNQLDLRGGPKEGILILMLITITNLFVYFDL